MDSADGAFFFLSGPVLSGLLLKVPFGSSGYCAEFQYELSTLPEYELITLRLQIVTYPLSLIWIYRMIFSLGGTEFGFPGMFGKGLTTMLLRGVCLLLAMFAVCTILPAQNRIVIQGGTMIDVRTGNLVPDAVIVLEGDRIASVSRGAASVPQGATVIDAKGKFIIPGLIDSHVHYSDWSPELFLNFGNTAVLDLGNDHDWIMAQKEGIERGSIPGPRMLISTTVIDGPPESANYFERPYVRIVKNSEEAATAVRSEIAAGKLDSVKVYAGLTTEMLKAIVHEADKAKLPVIGHFTDVRVVAEVGAKGVEHMDPVAHALVDEPAWKEAQKKARRGYNPPALAFMNASRAPAIVDLMLKSGQYLNPTLRVEFMGDRILRDKGFPYQDFDLLINDWRLRYAPLGFRLGVLKEYQEIGVWHWMDLSQAEQDQYHQAAVNSMKFVKMFADAGGKLYSGTDTGHMCTPGLCLHQELELLVDAGVSPLKTLQSATINAAELLRVQDRLGVLEQGKAADLVILDANPLEDIRNTRKIARVISRGRVLDGQYHADFENPLPNKTMEDTSHFFPSPRIRRVSPDIFGEDAQGATITVTGTGFIPYSFVRVNGKKLKTEYAGTFQLRATIPAKMLEMGTHAITVENPDFAWGTIYAPGAQDISHLGIRDRISNEAWVMVRPK